MSDHWHDACGRPVCICGHGEREHKPLRIQGFGMTVTGCTAEDCANECGEWRPIHERKNTYVYAGGCVRTVVIVFHGGRQIRSSLLTLRDAAALWHEHAAVGRPVAVSGMGWNERPDWIAPGKYGAKVAPKAPKRQPRLIALDGEGRP